MRRLFSVACSRLAYQWAHQCQRGSFSCTGLLFASNIFNEVSQGPMAAGKTQAAHNGTLATEVLKAAASKDHEVSDDDISITDTKGLHKSVKPLETFSELQAVPDWLAKGLESQKYPSTTVIQKYTIPMLDEGHDLIGLAPTGSGKTVAFAVPALKRLKRNQDGSPSVLVLAPTRELVQQTTKVFETLSCGMVRVCEAYGGSPREIQARRLHSGCDVLVACPGRLKDFLDNGDVSIENLSFIVFDEADRLLDMGFQIQLDDILNYISPSSRPQTMMWSATWPLSVQDLARKYLSEGRLLIRAGMAGVGQQANDHITQNIVFANSLKERIEKLAELIESGKIDDSTAKLIMFVERQTDTEGAAQALSSRLGIEPRYVGVTHGGLSQRQRDAVLNRFKNNHIRLLVATDVASRGLDIPDVTCVVNLQAPKNIDSYCHRIGRTGRAGREGEAYTFLSNEDGGIAQELIEYLQLCKMEVPAQLKQLAQSYNESNSRRRSNAWGRQGSRSFSGRRNNGYQKLRFDSPSSIRKGDRSDGYRGQHSDWPVEGTGW